MSDYPAQFKSCGKDVRVDDGVHIEHPQAMEVGDGVAFMRGFYMIGRPRLCRIGSGVRFFPNCFIQGSPQRFIVGDRVEFYPGTYISLGSGQTSAVEIGHHSHFAAGCALYGAGGLTIGAYCNVAAHVVLATIGHRPEITDRPMALAGGMSGPIVLADDVWVGANATITPNTKIAKGCVIGAGAVVTRDTEPMGVYVGVPARRLRDR